MELKIVNNDNIIFSSIADEIKSCYPLEYLKWIAKQLRCKISDLRILAVHSDFQEKDEEGWKIKSFFPADTKISRREVIHSDKNRVFFHFENFAIGEVRKIQVNRKPLIYDYNASPCTVWINKADLW